MSSDERTTDFGFRRVAEEEKSRLVGEVFSRVAKRYDVMNDLMSLGIQRVWKDALIDWLSPIPSMHLLDVAGGTGDIAFRFLSRLEKPARARATICDINFEMLSVCRERAGNMGPLGQIDFICGDAEMVPLPDAAVDAYTIAFGVRNVTHIDRALSEAFRVLKPGGHFLCLEFSKVDHPLLQRVYDLWSFNVIPFLGQAITNDRAAYEYLVESIRRFPGQEEFAAMLRQAGFSQVKYRNLTGGIVAIHSGWKR